MLRTQVYLTDEQDRDLKQLAAATGKKRSELIRKAVDGYLAERKPEDWKQALEAVRGMWVNREDLVGDLRSGWE